MEKRKTTVWVILHTSDKIILGKRSATSNNANQWNFFGGTVDSGENIKQAAVRELEEETTYKINASELKEIAVIGDAHYYSARINNPGDIETTDEISKVQRYKLIDLPNNLHSKTQNFFDKLDNLL